MLIFRRFVADFFSAGDFMRNFRGPEGLLGTDWVDLVGVVSGDGFDVGGAGGWDSPGEPLETF